MNIKNTIKHFLGRYPSIFFPLYRVHAPDTHIKECLLDEHSELVIEGFPRSANTYAVVAFRQAQNRDVPMAHHLHVEAQILRAVELKKPAIALIRKPTDAVKSLIIRYPGVSPDSEFRRYISFYSAIERVKNQVVLADFNQVTKDFGKIILEVNEKYGTAYKAFVTTKENVEKVYNEIDAINQKLDDGKETHVARPSKIRQMKQPRLHESNAMVVAESLYSRLTGDL